MSSIYRAEVFTAMLDIQTAGEKSWLELDSSLLVQAFKQYHSVPWSLTRYTTAG